MAQQEVDAYEFTLNIISVKMSVKFPCKMRMQHNGIPITSEVSTSDSQKFAFNQEIVIKDDFDKQRGLSEITVTLITEKGGKYIAGLIKLNHSELVGSQGQCITFPLAKCLDSQAFCQLRVDQVSTTKHVKKMSTSRVQPNNHRRIMTMNMGGSGTRQGFGNQASYSPPQVRIRGVGQINERKVGAGQTKSELNFPLTDRKGKNQWQDSKTRLNVNAAQSFMGKKPKSRSPFGGNRLGTSQVGPVGQHKNYNYDHMSAIVDHNHRDKLIEASVYKEEYTKLKEKYKKQAENAKVELNKRMNLENSQNNLKLEIMRLKMRTDQQEKNINEKNLKIKELQGQISNFQKKQLDLVYLKEEYSNKDHTIKMLQDSNRNLSRENQQLRNQSGDRAMKDQDKIKQYKKQLEEFKAKSDAKEAELQREIRTRVQALRLKDAQLNAKIDLLNRQKKVIEDLEKDSQNRLMDYERNLQMEKATAKAKIDELKLKLEKSQRQKSNFQSEKITFSQDLQKNKSILLKVEYENKILLQETEGLKKQLAELKIYKQKHAQVSRQLKITIDDRNHFQKQLERALQNKEVNISELTKQHQQQLQYFKKVNRELQQKQKTLTTKILELQSQVESSKGAQQKLKRSLETTTNQLNDSKQKEKSLRKSLKTKEQQILSLESDISSMKQKNKSGQHFLKHQIEQTKEELERVRNDFEQESMKNAHFSQTNAQLNVQLGKTKVKLQFMEQKAEKDTAAIQQKKLQIENLIRQHENQVISFNQTINNLRIVQKDLITKIQKQQIQALRNQDKLERVTKEAKVLQEKLAATEHQNKNKHGQYSLLSGAKKELQARVSQLQEELGATKNQNNQLQAEKSKNLKMIEIMKQETAKNKKDIQRLKHVGQDKEKQIEGLHSDIKRLKQQITKTEVKLNTMTSDFQRFREAAMQTMNNSFSGVLNDGKKFLGGSIVGTSMENSNIMQKNFGSKKSIQANSNNVTASTSEINHLIISYSKDAKLAVNKLGQQNKQLQRQNERLNEQLAGSINKGQNSEYELNRQIQQLEEQLTAAYTQRDQENLKFDHVLKQLNAKIREKDREVSDLNEQIEQLNFNLNTIRIDYDAQSNQNSKKNTDMKRNIEELQEKIDIISLNLATNQQKVFSLEVQRNTILGQLREERQNSSRKQKLLNQAITKLEQYERIIQDGKKQRKDLLEKNSELQLQLNTQKESSEKLKQLLQDQESKSTDLKNFISSLMKQKEQAIKSQLQKGEHIIHIQASLLQMTRDRDILSEEVDRLRKHLDQGKDSIKKTSGTLKDAETRISEQRVKNQKLSDKVKEKQKEIINLQESIQKLQSKYNRLSERSQKDGSELRQELELKTLQIVNISKEHSQKCFFYQKQKQTMQSSISQLKAEVVSLEQQIFNQKQSNDGTSSNLQSANREIQELRMRVNELQLSEEKLIQEIKEKQEITFELQGRLYNLQIKLQSKEIEKNERINELDNDWVCKFEGMCEEYQQRIELVEKERDYFKLRMQEQQDQMKKLINDRSLGQIQQGKFKLVLEDKIRKLEQQRLFLVSQKNNEIQKLSEEVKVQNNSIKNKDAEIRKNLHELEVARSTISKMDQKIKDNDEKLRNTNSVYQAQLQQLKKKENTYKNFKEAVSTMQWSAEREVRKVVQIFIKKSIEICEDSKNSRKMMDTVKNFEQSVVQAMRINLDDIK